MVETHDVIASEDCNGPGLRHLDETFLRSRIPTDKDASRPLREVSGDSDPAFFRGHREHLFGRYASWWLLQEFLHGDRGRRTVPVGRFCPDERRLAERHSTSRLHGYDSRRLCHRQCLDFHEGRGVALVSMDLQQVREEGIYDMNTRTEAELCYRQR
jgi:hypothetical protein